MKILIENRQRPAGSSQHKIAGDSKKVLGRLGIGNAELSILLVNDRKMRALNSKYRNTDKATDVLSFPQISAKEQKFISSKVKESYTSELLHFGTSALILGDVVINLQAAKRQAPEHGLTFGEEVRWLLVHGILHLVGYDHERSGYAARKMRSKERELLEYLGKGNR